MNGRFQNKVVVVTGASSGVGRACVRAFAQQGASLGLIARSRDGLGAAANEVRKRGGKALVLSLDVSDAEAVFSAAQDVENELGPIDIWINNAMVTILAPVWDITPEEFERVTVVTYLGYVYGTQAALRSMRQRDHGAIIQIGSALEYRSIPLQSAYCGAKAAIRGFTDSLRTELIHEGSSIKLTSMQLPAVNTPQFDVMRTRMPRQPMPVPPIFQPEMIADAVLWAAEHHPREMVVGGSSLRAIAGQKLAPSLVDRLLGKTGFDSQQREEEVRPDHGDNLFETLPGDRGARGSFSDESASRSLQLEARTRLKTIVFGGAITALALATSFALQRNR